MSRSRPKSPSSVLISSMTNFEFPTFISGRSARASKWCCGRASSQASCTCPELVTYESSKTASFTLYCFCFRCQPGRPALAVSETTKHLPHQVLAEMVGTTRSRINLFMNRFRKQGFIDYDGGLEVHESLRKA